MRQTRRIPWVAMLLIVIGAGCGTTRPIVDTSPPPPNVGGTIAGTVRATDGTTPLVGRTVAAVDLNSKERFTATTGINGGYTLQVPAGTYRLEVELRAEEKYQSRPDDTTQVGVGDIDSGRDFVITAPR